MKRKRNTLIAIGFVLLVLCTLLMYMLQSYLFYRNADREMELTFEDIDRIVVQAEEETTDTYDSYVMIHEAKTRMAKYYIRNDEDTGYSGASMKSLKSLLNVENVYLVDENGEIAYSASPTSLTGFTEGEAPYFDEMKKVARSNEVSMMDFYAVSAADDPEDVRYHSFCAAPLSTGYYVVIDDDASGYFELQEEANSWQAILPRITLGRNGFVFAVDISGWVSAFSDDDEPQITDTEGLGIKMTDLKDGYRGNLILQGDSYYCGVKYYDIEQTYIICAIPSEEITSNVLVVTAVPLFVTFIFLSLQLLYSLMLAEERLGGYDASGQGSFRRFLVKKMAVLLVLSVLFTFASSLYSQGLYATYLQAQSNRQEADALAESLWRDEEMQKSTSEEYYSALENLTTLAAKFISNNNRQITRRNLADMAGSLGAEHILLYDRDGEVILSDAYYKGLKISTNPRVLSYEFNKVLTGTPVLAQQQIDEEYLDQPYRYVGAIVTDADDQPNGFVQLAFAPDYLASSLSVSSMESLPSTFSGRNNAFAFTVEGEDKTFLYYPDADLIGEPVEDYGLTDEMMLDGYFTRISFEGEERLLYCGFWEKDLLFTAASVNLITMESISRGVLISIAGVVIQMLFFLAILLINGGKNTAPEGMNDEIGMDEDRKKTVETLAASRIMGLLRVSFFIFAGVICAVVIMKDLLFKSNDVLLDLLNGCWNSGIHIFSVTACWISICMVYFAVSLLLLTLELTGRLMNSRGETVVRMLMSFVRYIAVIGMVFYCARILGAPTDTLLASAGIMTVVLGFGAQSLVTDILAGLFIIFEKAFKVGDIIRMDGESWRGRVLEIGIRNTRVRDIDENSIKIIHNSSLNQIVNLTDEPTLVYTSIGTEYGAELERIEEIIRKELPGIHERIPAAIEGPRYSGVYDLGDSAVILRFVTSCRNEDYFRVRFDVNRELKLMFDRHSINVPFPQIVLNHGDNSLI
ncbi:MAG: mechanosensitive ion channel [Lachnospiraceae bacterium]|nr:mechanosensitive ion channel [Lachnospiraceae bacterium]